jgi:hypothetical protein
MSICPACAALVRADVYPAAFKPLPSGSAGDRLMADREAGCFYHSNKKATVACSSCGRFLCALCDVELNELHLCPQCFEKGRTKQKIIQLENKRTCYDSIALYVATVPLLVSWPFPNPVDGTHGDLYVHSLLESAQQHHRANQGSIYRRFWDCSASTCRLDVVFRQLNDVTH